MANRHDAGSPCPACRQPVFKYVGLNGAIIGMTTFGESAPAELLFEEFGFTVDNVIAKAKNCCNT
ncbi:hypothetical protein FI178_09560 [Salmonella enterica subsp. enterica]|nr:hypothetical protein [Salmonella enterica subsp. enterica]